MRVMKLYQEIKHTDKRIKVIKKINTVRTLSLRSLESLKSFSVPLVFLHYESQRY